MDAQYHGVDSEEFAIAEALRRSVLEQTREEAILADVIRASVLSHDEELARDMQAHFDYEQSQSQSQLSSSNSSSLVNEGHWLAVAKAGRRFTTPVASSHANVPPRGTVVMRVGNQSGVVAAMPPSVLEYNGANPIMTTANARLHHQQQRQQIAQRVAGIGSFQQSLSPHSMVGVPQLYQRNGNASTLSARTTRTTSHSSVSTLPHDIVVSSANDGGQSMSIGSPVSPPTIPTVRKLPTPSVVLDGLNVGCALGGGGGRFRSRGIEIALEYYRARGVYAIALVPENKVDEKFGLIGLADEPKLLMRLHSENRVGFVPMGAHDDNYLLTYAMSVDADLVSNDRYRKELGRQRGSEAAKRLRRFLKAHLVPFTFILEQFVPNPHPESLANHVHYQRDKGYR